RIRDTGDGDVPDEAPRRRIVHATPVENGASPPRAGRVEPGHVHTAPSIAHNLGRMVAGCRVVSARDTGRGLTEREDVDPGLPRHQGLAATPRGPAPRRPRHLG